jgi:hypothetical protein
LRIGYETSDNKFKKNKIISNKFSDHNEMKLEINSKRNFGKIYKYVEVRQHSPKKNHSRLKKLERKIFNVLVEIKWKQNILKFTRCIKSTSTKKFIAINVYLRKRKYIHLKNKTLTPQGTRKTNT